MIDEMANLLGHRKPHIGESIFDYCVNLAELGGHRKPCIGESYQDYSNYVESIHYEVVGMVLTEHIES